MEGRHGREGERVNRMWWGVPFYGSRGRLTCSHIDVATAGGVQGVEAGAQLLLRMDAALAVAHEGAELAVVEHLRVR